MSSRAPSAELHYLRQQQKARRSQRCFSFRQGELFRRIRSGHGLSKLVAYQRRAVMGSLLEQPDIAGM